MKRNSLSRSRFRHGAISIVATGIACALVGTAIATATPPISGVVRAIDRWKNPDRPTSKPGDSMYLASERSLIWAVTAYPGKVLASTDDGQTWRDKFALAGPGFANIHVLSNDCLVALSVTGECWTSEDGGTTFARTKASLDDGLEAAAWRNGMALAVGRDGAVFKSGASGSDWKRQSARTHADLRGISWASDVRAYIAGGNGLLLKTDDGGTNWFQQSLPEKTPLFDVSFHSANNGWIVGRAGLILRTTDGSLWSKPSASPTTKTLLHVRSPAEHCAIVAGLSGAAFITRDDGASWEPVSGLGDMTVSCIWADETGLLLLGLGEGRIVRSHWKNA